MNRIKVFTYRQASVSNNTNSSTAIRTHGSAVAIHGCNDKIFICHADMFVSYYKWNNNQDSHGDVVFTKGKALPNAWFSISKEVLSDKNVANSSSRESEGQNDKDLSSGDSNANVSVSTPPPPVSSPIPMASLFGSLKRLSDMSRFNRSPLSNSVKQESTPSMFTATNIVANRTTLNTSVFSVSHKLIAFGGNDVGATSNGTNIASQLVSAVYWDHSIKVNSVDTLKDLASNTGGHVGAINCLDFGNPRGSVFVTGGDDCTCRVWVLDNAALANALHSKFNSDLTSAQSIPVNLSPSEDELRCIHILYGHDTPVTAVSYDPELDISFSSSVDGTLCLHSVRQGKHIRTIHDLRGHNVDQLLISSTGYLVAYACDSSSLNLFWVNGKKITSTQISSRSKLFNS